MDGAIVNYQLSRRFFDFPFGISYRSLEPILSKRAIHLTFLLGPTSARLGTYVPKTSRVFRFTNNKHWKLLASCIGCYQACYPYFAVFPPPSTFQTLDEMFCWVSIGKRDQIRFEGYGMPENRKECIFTFLSRIAI